MLAQGIQLDVADYYHLVVVRFEDGAIHDVFHVLPVSLCEETERLGGALGGPNQSLPGKILADLLQYAPKRLLHKNTT